MESFTKTLKKPVRGALQLLDLKEHIKIFALKRAKRLFQIEDLYPYFQNTAVFAFATGGSLANLQGLERLKDKNIFIMNTGVVHFLRLYGVMPNIWLVHNPDSVEMTISEIKKYGMEEKISFENTFIMVPSNHSDSKIHFSSPLFKEFRSLIKEKACFVLYNERLSCHQPQNTPSTYLNPGYRPIQRIDGSAVENTFLPFLHCIGVKTIFFSGVDHLEHTGHFWDRDWAYQNKDGKLLKFSDIIPHEVVDQCADVALKKCFEYGIKVYRLEAEETMIKKYPYLSFSEAYEKSSSKILPQELVS